jgi:tRNA(Ile)-lysidine synthase
MVVLALLQQCCPERIRVIYINHQLHHDAVGWGQRVQAWCDDHHVPCTQIAVQVGDGNLEQAARLARYQAFDQVLQPHDVLVLGHHRQDQAETVLMRICAGGSVQGVAAMHEWQQRGHYQIWRPLLQWSRAEIDQWVTHLALDVVEDPANQDIRFDRVWLRQQLWPILSGRWPHAEVGFGRFAQNVQDVQSILHEVIAEDWQACRVDQTLSMSMLAQLSMPRQRQLLTWWLQGDEPYAPPQTRISTLLSWLTLNVRSDAVPEVDWQGWRVYGYRDRYYRVKLPLPMTQPQSYAMQQDQVWMLAGGQVRIWCELDAMPMSRLMIGQTTHLRARVDGERLQMSGKTQHSSLKKLLQSWQVLPWQRHAVTVWCIDDEVLGVFCSNEFYRTQVADQYLAGWQIEPYPSC